MADIFLSLAHQMRVAATPMVAKAMDMVTPVASVDVLFTSAVPAAGATGPAAGPGGVGFVLVHFQLLPPYVMHASAYKSSVVFTSAAFKAMQALASAAVLNVNVFISALHMPTVLATVPAPHLPHMPSVA